jgi:hypothetical protein
MKLVSKKSETLKVFSAESNGRGISNKQASAHFEPRRRFTLT